MKDKTKRILDIILDFIGYGMGISLSLNMTNILYKILRYGKVSISHSTGVPLLLGEIGLTSGTAIFFVYKFIKNMIDREKLTKQLKK